MGYASPSLSGAQMLDALTEDNTKIPSNKWRYGLSDDIIASDDAQELVTAVAYTKYKEFASVPANVSKHSAFRITFALNGSAGVTCYGRIYKNDVPFGTEQSKSGAGYVDESQDFVSEDFVAGDVISLYAYHSGTGNAYVKEFRVKGVLTFAGSQIKEIDKPSW